MNFEEWFLDLVKQVVVKNAYSHYRYTDMSYDDLAKGIKMSLKRQKVLPQNNWQFERKINFEILKRTKFSMKQIIEIAKFYYQDIDKDYEEFHSTFKNHKYFFSKGYMKSSDYGKISFSDWFLKEFTEIHSDLNKEFKNQLNEVSSQKF